MSGTALSFDEVYALARQAGFSRDDAIIMTAIAGGESGRRPTAHNPNPPDNSYGLWQINMLGSLGPARLDWFGLNKYSDLFDPQENAKAAWRLSRDAEKSGRDPFSPWTVYTSGAYRTYLDEAQSAARRVTGKKLKELIPHGARGGSGSPGSDRLPENTGPGVVAGESSLSDDYTVLDLLLGVPKEDGGGGWKDALLGPVGAVAGGWLEDKTRSLVRNVAGLSIGLLFVAGGVVLFVVGLRRTVEPTVNRVQTEVAGAASAVPTPAGQAVGAAARAGAA